MPKKTEEQVITTKEKETILPASPEKLAPTSILTISADTDIETPESIEDTNWHELQNAYRTKKILSGTLGGIEKLENDGTIAIVYYKDQRIVIPLSEMMIKKMPLPTTGSSLTDKIRSSAICSELKSTF